MKTVAFFPEPWNASIGRPLVDERNYLLLGVMFDDEEGEYAILLTETGLIETFHRLAAIHVKYVYDHDLEDFVDEVATAQLEREQT